MEEIKVGIGTYKIGKQCLLISYGLGSCVGVFLYDDGIGIGALGHVLLPGKCEDDLPMQKYKYCEDLIEMMVNELIREGVSKKNLKGKIAGGAKMFHFLSIIDRQSIGDKNIESVRKKLKEMKIPIIAEDVGNDYGRTIIANTQTGVLKIKTVKHGIIEI
jgi:chemotaxis protein CheD